MSNLSMALSWHIWAARGGETIDSQVIDRDTIPDITPTSNWLDLGIATGLNPTDNSTRATVFKGQPGRVVPFDEITLIVDRTYQIPMAQINPLAVELFFAAGARITAAGTFTPLAAPGSVESWIKAQAYDGLDQFVQGFDMWCSLSLANSSMNQGSLAEWTLNMRPLYSSLNTGDIQTVI